MQLAWKKLSERSEKIGYRWITHETFELPDGVRKEYTIIGKGAENAAVVAVTEDGKIVIARQFRPGPEAILDELPGGVVDDGEKPEAAAMRELAEETGYTSDEEPIFLGKVCRDAYKNEIENYFIVYNCYRAGDQYTDPTDFIEVREIDTQELLVNARAGKMSDGIAVLMAYDRLMEVQSNATKK